MDANVTASQSELDLDNSSLQNPSTNPAEAGTTDETRDEDHETSSIEALNWSEVEEEELAAAQQASLAASATQEKLPSETKVDKSDKEKDDESVTNNGSSTNDEGSMLSTTLLQSINSSVSDEDPQARKQSVIENWASEVTNAVERGEIEMTEDFPDENVTGDDEEEEGNVESNGVRKRKNLSPEMVASMMSSVSNGESTVDPLSNAPVLDDGPIWNKGPRSYTFQENRRINQKLTFCLLIAVVLAIGLGLGNLVAHQECEAEYKASQQTQPKHADKISVHSVPTTTTPAPIIPDRSTDSSMMGSSLPKKQPSPYIDSDSLASNKDAINDNFATEEKYNQDKRQSPPVNDINENRPRKRNDPVIDPKYKVHAETVSNVVHTLDRLSREIDQFENTTRKLQGVLMIPDEEKITETSTESTSLFDEEVHRDDDDSSVKNDDDVNLGDEEDETAIIEDLIDAIEQTPDYLELKKSEKRLEELNKNRRHSKIFDADPDDEREFYPGRDNDIQMMLKSIQQFKDFQRRFIKSERKRMRDEGKYNRFSWRLPEEYSVDEKNALRVRYSSNWREFLRLIKTKVPDPIETLFGVEEDEEERTYGDVFHYPFPDPDDDLTEDEYSEQFRKNLEELKIFEKNSAPSEIQNTDNSGDQFISETFVTPTAKEESLVEAPTILEDVDDLIISESKEDLPEAIQSTMNSAVNQQEKVTEQDQMQDDNIIGKSATIDETSVNTDIPVKSESSPSASPADADTTADRIKSKDEKLSVGKVKREAPSKFPSIKPIKPVINKAPDNANNLNGKMPETTNAKYEKREQRQKEQKNYKQGKPKFKNMSYGSNGSNGNNNQNVNDGANGGNWKMSSKGKKLKNLESNKVFENVKGKSFDKRRGASPETQRNGKFEAEIKYSDHLRNGNKDSAPHKKSTTGSTNKKEEDTGRHSSDTSSANNAQHKMRQSQNNFENDNQKTKLNNNNARNYQNAPKDGSRLQQDLKDHRQKRQDNHEKANSDFSSERRSPKPYHQEPAKETQFRQQKTEFKTKQDNRNPSSGDHPNGKRFKSWQSKEKADRREKARDRGSSWGN